MSTRSSPVERRRRKPPGKSRSNVASAQKCSYICQMSFHRELQIRIAPAALLGELLLRPARR